MTKFDATQAYGSLDLRLSSKTNQAENFAKVGQLPYFVGCDLCCWGALMKFYKTQTYRNQDMRMTLKNLTRYSFLEKWVTRILFCGRWTGVVGSWGTSKEYLHMFLWRNIKNTYLIPPHLELWMCNQLHFIAGSENCSTRQQ